MKKRLIINDQSNFKTIREAGAIYIDKTEQIYDCIGIKKYLFLARPRRFGKSMLCATLREMFLGSKELFKGLWLETSDWEWKKHPVIHLNMTGAAGAGKTVADIEKSLTIMINDIANDYGIDLLQDLDIATTFRELIKALHKKTGIQAVVIIDEYDKPLLDAVLNNRTDYTPILGLLKSFYGQLKALEDDLRFVFITGVFKFAKTSVFSDLNNLDDLTLQCKAGTIVGYTQEELEAGFEPEIEALMKRTSLSRTDLLMQLKENYNGYVFGFDDTDSSLPESVYNSFAINDVFNKNAMIQNGWFSTGSPSLLIHKLESCNFEPLNFENMQTPSSALINSCSPDKITAETILYYAGYVTIKNYDQKRRLVTLRIPNKEISMAMAEEILPRMIPQKSSSLIKIAAWDVRDAWQQNDFEAVKHHLNICLAMIHNELYTSSESYFHTLIMMFMQMADMRVEAEVGSKLGYADLILWLDDKIYVIEIKMDRPVTQALEQIHAREYYTSLLAEKKSVTLVGIQCSKKKRAVVELKTHVLN